MKRLFVATLLFAFALPAAAQETDDSGRQIKYKARTEIDFESIDVSGELVKPQGQLLLDRRKANFNPLIQLRDHFNEEMRQSINEIQ